MEVTRQLRHDLLNKKGLASIALTFCWAGQRMRKGSGEKCDPKHWNPKREEVKAAEHAATLQGQRLDPAAMWAEIQRRYALLAAGDEQAAEAPDLPPLPAPEIAPPGFFDYYDQWLGELTRKTSLTTGRSLSASYLASLGNARDFLHDLAEKEQLELSFAGMDADFYVRLSRFFFQGTWGESVNTFGKHVRHLKSLLAWAEDRDQPVNRKYAKWEAPDEYIGADALTQAEVLTLAGLDFRTERVRAYITQQFEGLNEALLAVPKKGMRRSQADPHRVAERLRMLELDRDKFLQCCYLGLRISDANEMRPQQIKGELLRLKASKTRKECHIPFFDDVFKPVALVEKYASLNLPTCLPVLHNPGEYLGDVAQLASLTRIPLTTKVGRKTFVTLKIAQGVPRAQVMQATGHKTEASFNRYLGVVEHELLDTYRKTARKLPGKGGAVSDAA